MYTLLIGIICLIIMMYIFDIQMSEVEYSSSNKRYVLKEDNYQRDKEYLTTLFSGYINNETNEKLIKAAGVAAYFKGSTGTIVNYGLANVSYYEKDNNFIFRTRQVITNEPPHVVYGYRYDYFKLEEAASGFNIVFIKTICEY